MGKNKIMRCKDKDTVNIRVHKDMLKKIKMKHNKMGKNKYSRTYVTKILARRL